MKSQIWHQQNVEHLEDNLCRNRFEALPALSSLENERLWVAPILDRRNFS